MPRGTATMMHDKRHHRRIPFLRPISVTTQEGDKFALMCTDFSIEGVGLVSGQPRDVGEILRVSMNIGHNGRTHILNALGEVVHRRYEDKKFLLGIRFYKDR